MGKKIVDFPTYLNPIPQDSLAIWDSTDSLTKNISLSVLEHFLAQQGAQGPAGLTGATGAQGPAGPQGIQGPAGTTTISTWKLVSANYTAIAGDQLLVNVNSSSVTVTMPDNSNDGSVIVVSILNPANNANVVNFVSNTANFNSQSKSAFLNGNNKQIYLLYFQSLGWQVIGTISINTSFPSTVRYRFSVQNLTGFSNNDLVTSVSDLSGNSFTATATGNASPTYKTNIIAGKPVLNFNGSTNYLDLSNSQIIPELTDFVIFQVALYADLTRIAFGTGGSTSGNWGLQIGGNVNYAVCGGSLVQANTNGIVNQFCIYAWARISGSWKAWVNGGTSFSGGSNTNGLRGVSNGYEQKVIIGAKWDGSTQNFMNGYIADTCVKLSPTISDINTIGNWYALQYSLTWNTAS